MENASNCRLEGKNQPTVDFFVVRLRNKMKTINIFQAMKKGFFSTKVKQLLLSTLSEIP